ncbi:ankyrin repeat domain-containing protein [Allopusillimonas ginsengisoli]|uniref:ankyrin repeat domain-containing protein n=1 Tax=Allopusillimonas ginsengisoli TaxID=453575 RepID=UPI0039C49652
MIHKLAAFAPVRQAERRTVTGRHARLSAGTRASLTLAGLLVCMVAHGANPADWWVDITNNRASNVKTMLAKGADPNAVSPDGQPAIMQAIREGAWDVYDVLLNNQGTVLNAINIHRETPLMYLAVLGETKRAQDLIRRGALVNKLGGWTPLQYAASKGHLDTVKMLVEHKAIVNAQAPDGTSALMMAAYGGSEPVVRYLLEQGADVTMRNLNKWDAADWARQKKHTSLAQALDNLTATTLAGRNAQHHAGASAPAASGPGNTVTHDQFGSSPASQASQTASGRNDTDAAAQSSDSSTSRYFDLDRFDKPVQP